MRDDLISRIRNHLFYQIKDELAGQIADRVLSLTAKSYPDPQTRSCEIYEEVQVVIDESFIHLMNNISACELAQAA